MFTSSHIAKLVSYVFQPLLMPTLAYAIILFGFPSLFGDYSFKIKINLLIFISLITLGVPILAILILYKFKIISDLMMRNKAERYIPMLFTTLIYMGLAFVLITKLPINQLFSGVMISIAFVAFFTTFITFFWKISIHSSSIGGLFSLLFLLNIHIENQLMFACMILLLIISGLVMTARLKLNEHNSWQILAGFVLGFVINQLVILRLFGEI